MKLCNVGRTFAGKQVSMAEQETKLLYMMHSIMLCSMYRDAEAPIHQDNGFSIEKPDLPERVES